MSLPNFIWQSSQRVLGPLFLLDSLKCRPRWSKTLFWPTPLSTPHPGRHLGSRPVQRSFLLTSSAAFNMDNAYFRFRRREGSLPLLTARARGTAQWLRPPAPPPTTPIGRAGPARPRSRSPPRPSLPPLRKDAQGRRGGPSQGALRPWADEADRRAALAELDHDAHAPSTLHAMEAKLRTIGRALAAWGLAPCLPRLSSFVR